VTLPLLVGDVGGTNARFALSDDRGKVRDMESFRVAAFATCEDAVRAYIGTLGKRAPTSFRGASFAAAGPVAENGTITLTNAPWHLAPDNLRDAIGGGAVRLFNDLEAVALALPHLPPTDYSDIGPPIADPLSGNLLALNVGTGLGAAYAVTIQGEWTAVASEAGHMTFSARTPQEISLLASADSFEDLLSGPGLSRLTSAILQASPTNSGASTSDIFKPDVQDPGIRDTCLVFTDLLARLAGDLVLAGGAWGGVYLTGSVVSAWAKSANTKEFRRIFAAKGKMQSRMQHVPTRLITATTPALFGLSYT
jgi:glucokinase